jgi:hypothetical protein
MTMPPEGGVGAAERVRAMTDDDPVRELPDVAVLSGAAGPLLDWFFKWNLPIGSSFPF